MVLTIKGEIPDVFYIIIEHFLRIILLCDELKIFVTMYKTWIFVLDSTLFVWNVSTFEFVVVVLPVVRHI